MAACARNVRGCTAATLGSTSFWHLQCEACIQLTTAKGAAEVDRDVWNPNLLHLPYVSDEGIDGPFVGIRPTVPH